MKIKLSVLITTILLCLSNILMAQDDFFSINELTGKVAPKNSGNPYKLRGEVYEAFLKMQQAALKDSIKINIVSSYRSYTHQQRIWNRKFKRFKSYGMSDSLAVEKIIKYSTIPGTSRHHWGTDIDITMDTKVTVKKMLLTSNYQNNGPFLLLKQWMDVNASLYGFKLVYTNEPKRKGFSYEPWHYTYYPTSKKMLQAYRDQNCKESIDINSNLGIKNSLTFDQNKYFNEYVYVERNFH